MPNAASVLLRPVVRADLPALYEFQLEPESCALAGVNPRSREAFNAVWDKILAGPPASDGAIARAIIADGQLAGSIGYFRQDQTDLIGYWIARPHWGRAIASRALSLMLREVHVRPLFAHVAAHNPASLRVLAKNGFVEIGRRQSPGTERYHACEEVTLRLA